MTTQKNRGDAERLLYFFELGSYASVKGLTIFQNV